jgi:hypothetical protein
VQQDDVVFGPRGGDGLEVPSLEGKIAPDASIDDRAVEGRTHGQAAGPVLRRYGHGKTGDVPVPHADEPLFLPAGGPSFGIAKTYRSRKHAVVQIELLPVFEHLHAIKAQPVAVLNPQHQRQPVRQVDQILVLDLAPGDLGHEAIVAAGEIGAGIVHAVGHAVRRGGARDEVAVAERAERFAQSLLRRLVAVVGQPPGGMRRHGAGRLVRWSGAMVACRHAATSSPATAQSHSRKRRTSSTAANAKSAAVRRPPFRTATVTPRPARRRKASSSVTSSPT